jgi:hypothetical protein
MAGTVEEKAAWLERVLGLRPSGPASAPAAPPQDQPRARDPNGPPALTGMAAWAAARAEAVAAIKVAELAVRNYQHPDSDIAMIELRAIRANLTPEPTTPQQIAELEQYLRTDDVVADAEGENGLGIALRLREPLLAALAGLRQTGGEPGAGERGAGG